MIARPPPITQPGNSPSVPLEDSNAAETLWEYGRNVIESEERNGEIKHLTRIVIHIQVIKAICNQ